MDHFNNKVVWITGASAGIGEAIARALARRGARLILSARRVDELKRVALETGLDAKNYLILPLDVTDYQAYPRLTEQVISQFGQIDYLFNNAGISTRALAVDSPVDVDRRVMDINYFGSIALSKAVLPGMIARQSGHIIVTSSVMGCFSTPMRSAYAASKHALHGFYNSLRMEVHGHNVHVTILCPGYIKTDISVNALTASGEKFNKMSKKQAAGMDPNELAEKVLKAIRKKRREATFGGSEIFGIYFNKFLPGLLAKKLRKMLDQDSFTQ